MSFKTKNLISSQTRFLQNKSDLDPWFVTGLIDASFIKTKGIRLLSTCTCGARSCSKNLSLTANEINQPTSLVV